MLRVLKGARYVCAWYLLFLILSFIPPARSESNSKSAREAFGQGLALKNEGRMTEAERYFKKALEEDPSNADYHFELANIFALERSTLPSAARELEQAVMIRPDFVAAHFNLGVVYKKWGKYEEARAEFKKAMALTPPDQPATPYLMQIGSIYEEQGFYDDAETLYKEALEKDYGNRDIRNALETLNERRASAAQRARREQASQLQSRINQSNSPDRRL